MTEYTLCIRGDAAGNCRYTAVARRPKRYLLTDRIGRPRWFKTTDNLRNAMARTTPPIDPPAPPS